MAVETHRLFFALWPDPDTRAALAAAVRMLRAQRAETGGRWVAPDRYHVTLQFLGGHTGAFPASRCAAVAGVAAALPPGPAFDLHIDVAASFGGRGAPWWLGTSAIPAALHDLWRRLGDALAGAGLPHDARADFTPHVTVLREAGRGLPTTPLGATSLAWPVASFALVHSGDGGYAVLDTWPLRPAPAPSA